MKPPIFAFDLQSCLCAIAAAVLVQSYGANVPQMILWAFLAAVFGRKR